MYFFSPMPKQTHWLWIYKCGFQFNLSWNLLGVGILNSFFSVSKERQLNPRLDCHKEKYPKSKVNNIQKETFNQTQFRILGCLFKQTTDGVQHRDLLSHFQFCWPQDPNIVCLLWCQGGFQPRQTQYQISTLNKRVQSELGVPLIPGTIH